MAEKLGMVRPGMGVPSESPVIRTERELKEARKLGSRLYEYALTEQYIVQDTGRELARVRAEVARLEVQNAAMAAALRAWADDIACPKCKNGTMGTGDDLDSCPHCEGSCIDWPRFHAALSDAGKGWLPPEVILRYGHHDSHCHETDHPHMHHGVDCDKSHPCDCGWVEVHRAALDALKGE